MLHVLRVLSCFKTLGWVKFCVIFFVVPRDPMMTHLTVWSSGKWVLFAYVKQWKIIGLSVVLSRLCEVVGTIKMFRLSSDSLISIVSGVWFIKVVTCKSFRNKKDNKMTQNIWFRRLDDVVGKKVVKNQSLVLLCLSILLRCDVEYYLQCLILLNFVYIHWLWLAYPYLFVLCTMIIWHVCYMLAGDNTNAYDVWSRLTWGLVNLRFLFILIKQFQYKC